MFFTGKFVINSHPSLLEETDLTIPSKPPYLFHSSLSCAYGPAHKYKTAHLIVERVDMPGTLSEKLSAVEMPPVADAGNDRGVSMR